MIRFVVVILTVGVAISQASVIQTGISDEIVHNDPYQLVQQPQLQQQHQPGYTIEHGSVSILAPDNARLTFIEKLPEPDGLVAKIKLLTPKLLKQALKIVAKVGVVAVVALSVAILGIGFTAAVCTYTNVCTFKLASLHWNKLNSEKMEEVMRAYVTQDKLSTLTNFVTKSINEFMDDKKSQ